MESMKLFSVDFINEENAVYQLEYYLIVRSAEQGKTYGVGIEMTDVAGNKEADAVESLCENREDAEQFLYKLADGLALPVELTALCDDNITAMELGEKYTLVQAS